MVLRAADMRLNYTLAGLNEADLDSDPFQQFAIWFQQAKEAGVPEANAMVLATASAEGIPAARVVLLKDVDERGFVFYSNYESAKGRDLAENPHAALTFYWPQLERQVRISGTASRVSREETLAYFESRPLGSRLGATLSRQSEVIPGRAVLEAEFERLQAAYPDGDVPLPAYWGGTRVVPEWIEFWQGRTSRLHERDLYVLRDGDPPTWELGHLFP